MSNTFHVQKELATTPATGRCVSNRYWVTHPHHGIVFRYDPTAPLSDQYAGHSSLTEIGARIVQQQQWPDHTVEFFPVVFLAHAERQLLRHIRDNREAA